MLGLGQYTWLLGILLNSTRGDTQQIPLLLVQARDNSSSVIWRSVWELHDRTTYV